MERKARIDISLGGLQNTIKKMFNFFNKRKSNIHSIFVPDFNWEKEKEEDSIIHWVNPEQGIALSLNYFYSKPDIPSIKQVGRLRDYYRNQIVAHNGGLIQVDLIDLKRYPAIKTIFKIPQQPKGVVYLGSLTIPFRDRSYVIKIQALELGMTGVRYSVILDRFLREGNVNIDNWSADPYNSTYTKGTRMNKSEAPEYDVEFEDHPLTRVRKYISEIEENIVFKPELEKLTKFE